MRIGQLAARVGVNPKTIRYYESIGLLPEPARTDAGYRAYGDEDVERLSFVRRAQQLEVALDEIREILALRERDERPCGYVLEIARSRLGDLDRRIADMRRTREDLHALLRRAADRRMTTAATASSRGPAHAHEDCRMPDSRSSDGSGGTPRRAQREPICAAASLGDIRPGSVAVIRHFE
jgi:DNA-binding transcriptional MerR regulator